MRTFALAIALMMGGTALAQASTTSGTAGNAGSGDMATQNQPTSGSATADTSSQSSTTGMNGQSQGATDSNMSGQTQTGWNNSASGQAAMASNMSTGSVVQPGNRNPRRDARGVRVISQPAVVPAGWNGTANSGTGMGGPLLDPNTGQPMGATGSYPPCSRGMTDKCVQTYEVRRRHR